MKNIEVHFMKNLLCMKNKILFNGLPLKIRKCDNYNVFKSEVKTPFYSNLLYSVNEFYNLNFNT